MTRSTPNLHYQSEMKKVEDKDKRTKPNVITVKDVSSMYDQTSLKVTFDPWTKA